MSSKVNGWCSAYRTLGIELRIGSSVSLRRVSAPVKARYRDIASSPSLDSGVLPSEEGSDFEMSMYE